MYKLFRKASRRLSSVNAHEVECLSVPLSLLINVLKMKLNKVTLFVMCLNISTCD